LTGLRVCAGSHADQPLEHLAERVFLSVRFENGRGYCMAAHSTIADSKSKVPLEVTNALRRGDTVPDPRLRALGEFTRTMVIKRGLPAPSDCQPFLAAGYAEGRILYIVLATAVKTLSNYAYHLFDTPVDPVISLRLQRVTVGRQRELQVEPAGSAFAAAPEERDSSIELDEDDLLDAMRQETRGLATQPLASIARRGHLHDDLGRYCCRAVHCLGAIPAQPGDVGNQYTIDQHRALDQRTPAELGLDLGRQLVGNALVNE
jgi:hypothetical protein